MSPRPSRVARFDGAPAWTRGLFVTRVGRRFRPQDPRIHHLASTIAISGSAVRRARRGNKGALTAASGTVRLQQPRRHRNYSTRCPWCSRRRRLRNPSAGRPSSNAKEDASCVGRQYRLHRRRRKRDPNFSSPALSAFGGRQKEKCWWRAKTSKSRGPRGEPTNVCYGRCRSKDRTARNRPRCSIAKKQFGFLQWGTERG